MGFREVFLKFSRVILIIVNIIVVLFGLAAFIVGIWGATRDRDYTKISGDTHNYRSIPILLLVIGLFIFIIGAVGFIGAFCGTKLAGRIVLFVYAVVVGILTIMAIAGGIAIIVQRDNLKSTFYHDTEVTLNQTSTHDDYLRSWNDVQESLHCCGVYTYKDWLPVNWLGNGTIDAIPQSCCNPKGHCGDFKYIPDADVASGKYKIYENGCTSTVIDKISEDIRPIAGISLTVAIVLLVAVIMAFAVALFSPKTSYEMV